MRDIIAPLAQLEYVHSDQMLDYTISYGRFCQGATRIFASQTQSTFHLAIEAYLHLLSDQKTSSTRSRGFIHPTTRSPTWSPPAQCWHLSYMLVTSPHRGAALAEFMWHSWVSLLPRRAPDLHPAFLEPTNALVVIGATTGFQFEPSSRITRSSFVVRRATSMLLVDEHEREGESRRLNWTWLGRLLCPPHYAQLVRNEASSVRF